MDSKIKRRAILISIGMILLVVIVAVSGNLSRLKNRFSEKEEEETTESEAPSRIASLTEDEAADGSSDIKEKISDFFAKNAREVGKY